MKIIAVCNYTIYSRFRVSQNWSMSNYKWMSHIISLRAGLRQLRRSGWAVQGWRDLISFSWSGWLKLTVKSEEEAGQLLAVRGLMAQRGSWGSHQLLPLLCGATSASLWWTLSEGWSYWHREVPRVWTFLSQWDRIQWESQVWRLCFQQSLTSAEWKHGKSLSLLSGRGIWWLVRVPWCYKSKLGTDPIANKRGSYTFLQLQALKYSIMWILNKNKEDLTRRQHSSRS